ncbi:LAFE_0H02388g1_1 [Lachancea fermentati]|uniref:LAFE_0H02388g1_1 n=1 Tax=Lachancea fermentati TaxID=4955 RepID=A0A1G4MJ78_LACFM|nr:LAFE_0H02388g1_1 [Lachancea fermentati]
MLGLSKNIYQVPPSSSLSVNSKEERFDYDESESDENDEGVSMGKLRLEQGFSFRSFIDQINAKTKALAMAREMDAERGIRQADANGSVGSIDTTTSTSTDVGQVSNDTRPKANIRRIPSGARPSTAEPNLGTSTPMKSAPPDNDSRSQTISDLLVQSTPLAPLKSAHINREQQPKDILKDKLMETHKNQNEKEEEILSAENDNDILNEISKLKKDIELYQQSQSRKEEEFQKIEQSLREKDDELERLRGNRSEQEEVISLLHNQLNEHREYIELLQKDRKDDAQKYQQTIDTLEKQLQTVTSKLEVNNTLEERLRQATENLEMEKKSSGKVIEELEKALGDIKETNVQLSSSMEDLKKCKISLTQEAVVNCQEIDNLRRKLAEHEEEIDRQQKEKEKVVLGNRAEISALSSANDRLQAECERLKKQISILEKQHLEHESLRDGLEKTNKGMLDVIDTLKRTSQEQHETIAKLEAGAEKRWNKEMQALSHFKLKYEKLEAQCQTTQNESRSLRENLEKEKFAEQEFREFLVGVSLFEVDIGSLILTGYQQCKFNFSLDGMFTETNSEFIGFKSKQDILDRKTVESKLEASQHELELLTKTIETEWKPKVDVFQKEQERLAAKNDELELKLAKSEVTIRDLERSLEELNDKVFVVSSERDSYAEEKHTLNEQNKHLDSKLEAEEKRTLDLSTQIEKLISEHNVLTEQLNELRMQLESGQQSLNQKDELLDVQQKSIAEFQGEIAKLHQYINKIEGKSSKKITFQVASHSHPHLTKRIYDSLMVDAVNNLNLVELQNMVKNMILLLEIPLSKLTKKIPLVSIYLRYEKSLCLHFANRLHHLVFHEAIDIKRFTNVAYGQYLESHDICHLQHPLEKCLENLFKEVSSRLLLSP